MTLIRLATQTNNNPHYNGLQLLGYKHLGIEEIGNFIAVILNIGVINQLDTLVSINLSPIHQVFSELSSQFYQVLNGAL